MTPETWLKLGAGTLALAGMGIFAKILIEAGAKRFLGWLGMLADAADNIAKLRVEVASFQQEHRTEHQLIHSRINAVGMRERHNTARLNQHDVRLRHLGDAVVQLGGDLPLMPPLHVSDRDPGRGEEED